MPHPIRLLADVPASGWAVVAASVLRSLALCVFALITGSAVDALIARADAGPALALAGGLLLVAAGLGAVEALLPPVAQGREERRARGRVMRALLEGPVDDERPIGERTALATEETERFAHYRAGFLGPLIGAFLVPIVVLIVIAWAISAGLALGLAVGVALIPPVIAWFMARFRAGSGRFRMISGRLTASFLETIRTLGTIRLLGAETQRRRRLAVQAEALRTEAMRLLRRNQIVLLVTEAVFGLVMLSLVGTLAVAGVAAGELGAGDGFALLLLTVLLREPVDHLGRSFYVGLAGRAAGERITAALPACAAGEQGRASATADGSALVADGALVARDLRVERGGRRVVTAADLVVRTGLTAVVGPSGAGKSSLALALAGLIPARGLRLGGVDAEAPALRERVAYIPQRSVLFGGTVRENLLLGRPHASDEELRAALTAAGFARGGDELPAGLDTPVGQGRQGVSGGQAQRLSIARALLTGRSILVADEPTAHLDSASAERVVVTLRALAAERAVILITHRLHEAAHADTLVVMTDGRVTAAGSPAELRREDGFYREALRSGTGEQA